jgi:hypothetical protein
VFYYVIQWFAGEPPPVHQPPVHGTPLKSAEVHVTTHAT